ncbi:MAG: hypothetical protein HONBIEJF_00238 [Fimbriimonadaceae bacterium]|nr:hypothetical protein [Fimbriimonadaceae bacterium]
MGATALAGSNKVLAIAYSAGFTGDENVDHLRQSLVFAGMQVTWIDGGQPGQLAQKLGEAEFDQVWVYDITEQGLFVNEDDAIALGKWHRTRQSVVFDARSYGNFANWFVGNPEDLLVRNIALNFAKVGGGLWFGTDHAPLWVSNANFLGAALGYNPVTGLHHDLDLRGDLSSPLLTNPFPIDLSSLTWLGTVGSAPQGLQPNGTFLNRLIWNGDNVTLTSAHLVPEPATMVAVGVAFTALLARRRR